MTRPRSPRGFRAKGNLGEATIKHRLEMLGHTVLNGAAAESAVDLILLCCQTLVEVKTQAWGVLPSPKRRLCAQAGNRWRTRGYDHYVVCRALDAKPVCFIAGMANNQASILYIVPELLTAPCRGGPRIGVGQAPVPSLEAESAYDKLMNEHAKEG